MRKVRKIDHLREAHDLSDRTIVDSLDGSTAETIADFLDELHWFEHDGRTHEQVGHRHRDFTEAGR